MDTLASYRTKIKNGMVPVLQTVTRSHLNLPVLRSHPKWRGLSNSDMMPGAATGLLKRAARDGRYFMLDNLPDCIRITPDKSGFMATVELLG